MDFDLVNSESLIKLGLILPLVAAFFSFKIKNPNFRDSITVLIGVALFYIACNIYHIKLNGGVLEYKFAEFIPNLPIYFKIDFLGVLFFLLASFLWIITTIYAVGYMRGNKEKNQNRFFGFFAVSIFATIGIAFSGNLLTLFIFYEVLTLSTYPLVTHSGTKEAKLCGRKYLGVLLGTSICFLFPAIIITYLMSGNLDFSNSPMLSEVDIKPIYVGLLLLLYIFGIAKAAVMPFHKWLPAAMVAPTPVSALLHAVAVVKAGLFTIIKVVVYVFGVENLQELLTLHPYSVNWAAWLAAFTILAASVIALRQDNLKLRLAYSTISQLSYVVLAAMLFNPKAIIAGSFHIVAHAFSKITLFFAAGAIYTTSKKKYISELNGIAKRMPITCLCFAIAAISMIGLPPTAGLVSKFYLIQGVYERDASLLLVIIISTILNAMYFLPIIFAMYFAEENIAAKGKLKNHKEAPKTILFAISITAIGVIIIFFCSDKIINLATLFVNGVN